MENVQNIKEYYALKNSNVIYELINITKNVATLKNNNITLKTDVKNIHRVDYMPKHANHKKSYTIEISEDVPSSELMLRHLSREEALEELDRFMDKAIAHHLPQVRIIHGRHGNVLRIAVRKYLDANPYVIHYEYADLAHGSVGATVAILNQTCNN